MGTIWPESRIAMLCHSSCCKVEITCIKECMGCQSIPRKSWFKWRRGMMRTSITGSSCRTASSVHQNASPSAIVSKHSSLAYIAPIQLDMAPRAPGLVLPPQVLWMPPHMDRLTTSNSTPKSTATRSTTKSRTNSWPRRPTSDSPPSWIAPATWAVQ